MRDLEAVVQQMIAALAGRAPEMAARLLVLVDDAAYTAPERMRDRWVELTYVFNGYAIAVWGVETKRWPAWYREAGDILAGRRFN